MKKLFLFAVALVIAFGSVAQIWAQAADAKFDPKDLSGQWQGTAQAAAGQSQRVVFLVSKDKDGSYKTVFNYTDLIAAGNGIPRAATLTLAGTTVTIKVPGNGGAYAGTLSADGKGIEGKWTQGGPEMTLNLVRPTPETAWEVPKPPPTPARMAANADPSFEVATIKPNDSGGNGKGFRIQGGRNFSTINTSLADLIVYAYDVHMKQVIGGPDWIDSAKFDVAGIPDKEGSPSNQQWKDMVKKLLADRFQLKFHHDKKELSVYILSVTKDGPRNMPKSDSTDDGFSIPIAGVPGGFIMRVRNVSMLDFTGFGLQGAVLDRPVLDQTGLKGRYDFQLSWAPLGTEFGGKLPPPQATDNPPPNLFTAMQEQLGLKLEATKAPADVLVIDHAEKPSAN